MLAAVSGLQAQNVLVRVGVPGFDGAPGKLVALGDANLDGDADFAVALLDPLPAVEIRTARNGQLLHRVTPAGIATAGAPSLIAAGDANGDAAADLWINDGVQLWCISGLTGTVLRTLPSARYVDAGHDLDRDGRDDLLLGGIGAGGNECSVRSGWDGSVLHHATLAGPVRAAAFAGDVDADGHGDLALVYIPPTGSDVAAEVVSGATGAVLRSRAFGQPLAPFAVGTLGDVDGDGHDDDYVYRLTEFGPPPLALGVLQVYSGATGAGIETWDGTVRCVRTSCSVLRRFEPPVGAGRFRAGARVLPLLRTQDAVVVPFAQPGQGDAAVLPATSAAATVDVDRDGFDDVLLGSVDRVDVVSLASGLRATATSDGILVTGPLAAVGDVDGDGVGDYGRGWLHYDPLMGQRATLSVHRGSDGALLFSLRTPSFHMATAAAAAGDVDGDGKDDVAIAFTQGGGLGQVSVHDQAGGVLLSVTGSSLDFGERLAAGSDWTGDGVPDLFVSDGTTTHVVSGQTGALVGALPAATQHLLRLGDMDGDGEGELLQDVTVWSTRTQQVLWTVPAADDYAAAGDVDGDGKAELWATGPGTQLRLVSGATGAVVRTIPAWPAGVALHGGADWDGDGVFDLARGDAAGSRVLVVSGTDANTVLFEVAQGGTGDDFGAGVALLRDASGRAVGLAAIATDGGAYRAGYTNLYSDPASDAAVTVFGHGCGTARGALRLGWQGDVPLLGVAGSLSLTHAAVPSVALFVVGGSDRDWRGLPLPVPLAGWGFGGCLLHAGPDIPTPVAVGPAGTAQLALAIPVDPVWVGTEVYGQALAADFGMPAGWAFSDAVRLVPGVR